MHSKREITTWVLVIVVLALSGTAGYMIGTQVLGYGGTDVFAQQ